MMPGGMPPGAPGMTSQAPNVPAGPTAPATVPPDPKGLRLMGVVDVAIAAKLIERALKNLGTQTPDGQAALKALMALSKITSGVAAELTQQEAKLIGEQAVPITPGSDAQQGQIRQRLQGMGMGNAPGTSSARPPSMAA